MTDQVEKTKLDKKYFKNVKVNLPLVFQIYNILKSNKRSSIAHTKTRSEVAGGGRKPWKQKGTGRARHGSIRSPLWIGGGITFGPRSERNYQRTVNKKVKKSVLNQILANFEKNKKLIVIDQIPNLTKTKEVVLWLSKFPIEEGRITLVCDRNKENMKAFNNISYLNIQYLDRIQIDTIIESDWVIIPEAILLRIGN